MALVPPGAGGILDQALYSNWAEVGDVQKERKNAHAVDQLVDSCNELEFQALRLDVPSL